MQNKKNVRSLWRAVIMQAVVDAISNSKNRRAISRSKKAHDWFKKDEGFIQTCIMADIEPNYVQKKVSQYFKNRMEVNVVNNSNDCLNHHNEDFIQKCGNG